MDKKDTITKMKILRDYMSDRISQDNGKNIDINVKALDTIYKNESDKENLLAIYLITMKYTKDGKNFNIEQYYSEDLQDGSIKFLAGNNRDDNIEKIYLSMEYTDDRKTKEYIETQLNEMSKESELDLNQLEKMAKELGIDLDDIENISELNVDQEIQNKKDGEKDEKENDEEKDEEEDKDEHNLEQAKEKKKETQEEKLEKISGKQEVNINAKFDGKTPLRKELNLSGEYKTIMVVYSEKLKDLPGYDGKTNNSPLAFVAIKNDGSAEKMDSLELDTSSGSIPTKEAISADADGTASMNKNTLSRYKIVGKNAYLSVQRGMYGEMKVYHGSKTKEENRPVEFQLETNNIRPTTAEMRNLQHPGEGEYHIDDIDDEFQKHVNHGEKELKSRKDYDGDDKTATHIHEDDNSTEEQETSTKINIEDQIEDWAELIQEDVEVFNKKEIEEMIKNYWTKDKGSIEDEYTVDEIRIELEKIEENIKQDDQNMRMK